MNANVEYRGPAGRGDIARAVQGGARIIGLIDGVFHQSLAVTPREVRNAALSGARLFGGASIGALRACECPDTMHGVGAIWQAFVRGDITDDDEVAMTFVPTTFEVVAYPLVQVREACRLAGQSHPHCRGLLASYLESIRALPFHERTLAVLRPLAEHFLCEEVPWKDLERWLTDPQFDVKRRDAFEVVALVENALEAGQSPMSSRR